MCVCNVRFFPLAVLHPSAQKRRMMTSLARTVPTSPAPGTNRPPLSASHQQRNSRNQDMSSAGQTVMIQMNLTHKNHNRLLVHMVRYSIIYMLEQVVSDLSETLIHSVLRFVFQVKTYYGFKFKSERSLICLQFAACGSVKLTCFPCALWSQVQLFKHWRGV